MASSTTTAERQTESIEQLSAKKCSACTGKVPVIPREDAKRSVGSSLPGWEYLERPTEAGGDLIARRLRTKDFKTAMALLNRIADIAEAESHHPDLHLTGYRNVAIEINTHSVKGVTENDFILAAKIESLLPTIGLSAKS